jgi:hypothetical protein
MTKNTISIIILFIIGLLSLISSFVTIIKDIHIDLSKSQIVAGQVTYADTKEIRSVGFRWMTFKPVFYFKLNNSTENFAIYRSYEGYEDLKSDIKIGDTIKVFYRPSVDDYNRHVFQVEKGNKILEDYKDYNDTASTQAGITLFIGVILILGSVLWYKKFNLFKFMTSWVER